MSVADGGESGAAPMRCVGEVTLKRFAAACAMYAVDPG